MQKELILIIILCLIGYCSFGQNTDKAKRILFKLFINEKEQSDKIISAYFYAYDNSENAESKKEIITIKDDSLFFDPKVFGARPGTCLLNLKKNRKFSFDINTSWFQSGYLFIKIKTYRRGLLFKHHIAVTKQIPGQGVFGTYIWW